MKQFSNGIFHVKITNVTYGESKFKKSPFFCCRFENEYSYYDYRIYLNGNSIKYRKYFYSIAGISSNKYDGSGLIGANLCIEIVSGSYWDKKTEQTKTFPQLKSIFKYIEYTEENIYDDENSIGNIANIFGVDMSELADDMDIDISDINTNDIMEYAGY